jgi:hypothetical protein
VIIAMGAEMLTRKPGTGKPSALLRSVMSFLSGVTAGLFGIDLLFLAYLERVTQRREEFRGNVCFVFIIEGVFRTVLYIWGGMFSRESLLLSLIALPASLLGMGSAHCWTAVSDRLSHRSSSMWFILGGVSTSVYACSSCSEKKKGGPRPRKNSAPFRRNGAPLFYSFTVPSALKHRQLLQEAEVGAVRRGALGQHGHPAGHGAAGLLHQGLHGVERPAGEITSSISRIRLPRIRSASSRPRYSACSPAVVMDCPPPAGDPAYRPWALPGDKVLLSPGLAGHLMDQGNTLGLRRKQIVIALRRNQLQKLPGAGHRQFRVSEDDECADVQIIGDLADGQFPFQSRYRHGIGMHSRSSLNVFPHRA